jgi:hypothetical protein
MIGSFDRIGFRRHSRAFRAADLDVDLSGTVDEPLASLPFEELFPGSAALERIMDAHR